jgi:hypothetical protein
MIEMYYGNEAISKHFNKLLSVFMNTITKCNTSNSKQCLLTKLLGCFQVNQTHTHTKEKKKKKKKKEKKERKKKVYTTQIQVYSVLFLGTTVCLHMGRIC